MEKRLFPYIPFYIARYEKEITFGGSIEDAVKDLEYFRDEMVHLHKEGALSDDELVDLMGFVNTIVTHIITFYSIVYPTVNLISFLIKCPTFL